jgi:hypothetical protein
MSGGHRRWQGGSQQSRRLQGLRNFHWQKGKCADTGQLSRRLATSETGHSCPFSANLVSRQSSDTVMPADQPNPAEPVAWAVSLNLVPQGWMVQLH